MTSIRIQIKRRMQKLYDKNKAAAIGDTCVCPACLTEFRKTHYQQKFCKTRPKTFCKDYYWNNVDENKRNNTTRISPASAEYLRERINARAEDFDDDQSWDAHKDHN